MECNSLPTVTTRAKIRFMRKRCSITSPSERFLQLASTRELRYLQLPKAMNSSTSQGEAQNDLELPQDITCLLHQLDVIQDDSTDLPVRGARRILPVPADSTSTQSP